VPAQRARGAHVGRAAGLASGLGGAVGDRRAGDGRLGRPRPPVAVQPRSIPPPSRRRLSGARAFSSLLLAKLQREGEAVPDLTSTGTPERGLARVAAVPDCPDRVRLYHADTGRRMLLPCRRRVCEYCGPVHWRPRALAVYHSGVDTFDPNEFLAVLLTAPGDVDVQEWNATASERWHNFMTILRRTYPSIQYWRVAELQRRGAIHFHILFRGVRFLPANRLRGIARAVGFGGWVGVRRCAKYRYGANGGARYFGKYLLKSFPTKLGVSKLVTYSQGWRVTWVSQKRASTGKWIYAGSRRQGWSLVGWDALPDVVESVRTDEWCSWWRGSWQRDRARWAVSCSFWPVDRAATVLQYSGSQATGADGSR